MRNRTTLTLLLGLIVGISGAAYIKNSEKARRSPASIGLAKKILLPPGGKSLSMVKVEAQTPEYIPESGDEEITVTARVLVSQNLGNDLVYSWNLPPGVKLVSGTLSDRLANVKQGQIVELKITVKGFTKEFQNLISVQASTQMGETVLGNSAVIASRPEDTWESVAPDMVRDAQEQLGTVGTNKGSTRE